MKKVILLSTGGTIASTAHADGRAIAGALTGEDLIKQIQIRDGITLGVQSVFQKPSNAITLADLRQLHHECQTLIDSGDVSGIVITHGTDTLEDTAYFLDTTLQLKDVVVVVTGSQRVPHAMGTDAFTNLQNAVHIAADNRARHMGVLVAFNEMIYAAAFVRKVSSFQVNGFDAPGFGCLGLIDNGTVTIYQRPQRLPVLGLTQPLPDTDRDAQRPEQPRIPENSPDTAPMPETSAMAGETVPVVDIVSVYLGARPQLLDAAVQSGAQGVVIDGLGRGHVPPDWVPAVTRALEAGVIILICSSTLHGPVYQSYDFQGSLHQLETAGAIGVSGLSARKARIRLTVLLSLHGLVGRRTILEAFTGTGG